MTQILKSNRHPLLLDRDRSVLVVVDMQESFLNVIHGRDALTANVTLLCRAATILQVPIIRTTQYTQRLGGIVPEIQDAIGNPDVSPVDKMCFSCAGSEAFHRALQELSREQVVLCGVETHICVSQTAHDLFHFGYQVHVAADAVSSRTVEKHKLGMERIRDAGVRPCAAESAVYEWLEEAGTPEFKAILPCIK
jgi:nicotinamidase-related amidase